MAQKKINKHNETFLQKKQDIKYQWFVLDAAGKTLGRFCAEVAKILRGKHKVSFTPHIDTGDGVIIINADKIRVTGSKRAQKIYREYTGSMGGLKETPFDIMQARKPTYILEHAVKGMMPHSRLARAQLKRLRIFAGEEHQLPAQQPVKVNI